MNTHKSKISRFSWTVQELGRARKSHFEHDAVELGLRQQIWEPASVERLLCHVFRRRFWKVHYTQSLERFICSLEVDGEKSAEERKRERCLHSSSLKRHEVEDPQYRHGHRIMCMSQQKFEPATLKKKSADGAFGLGEPVRLEGFQPRCWVSTQLTFIISQVCNGSLQHGGFVHFFWWPRYHGAQLVYKIVEDIPAFFFT